MTTHELNMLEATAISVLIGITAVLLHIKLRDKKKSALSAWAVFCLVVVILWVPSNLFIQRHDFALINAAATGDFAGVKSAIHDGADIHYPFRDGGTFLHLIAGNNGDIKIAEFFIDNGISVDVLDKYGNTAYDIAIQKNNSKLSSYLHKVTSAKTNSTKP